MVEEFVFGVMWYGDLVLEELFHDLFLMVEDKDPFMFSYLSILEDSQLQFSSISWVESHIILSQTVP
jgi:hypothetical protein